MLAVTLYFSHQLTRFERRQGTLEKIFKMQVKRLSILNTSSQSLRDSMERIEMRLGDFRTDWEKQKYVLGLARAKVSRKLLTQQDQDLLAAEAGKTVNMPETAESLYLQAAVEPDIASKIKKLERALEKNPKYEPAYAALGRAYNVARRHEDAFRVLTIAINLKEDDFSLAERCFSQVWLSRHENAIHDCDKSIEINSRSWVPYHYRGFAHYKLKNDKEAEKDWVAAAELRPELVGTLENLGLIYLRNHDWDATLDNAESLNLLDDESSWNWLFTLIAAERRGRDGEATEARKQWNKLRTPQDVEGLKFFLPPDLQSNLEAP